MLVACPPSVLLGDFLAGRISEESAGSIEHHLAVCPQCQAQAERLTSESDSLLAAARSQAASDPVEEGAELAQALSPSADSAHRPRLAPGQRPTSAVPEIRSCRLIKAGRRRMGTVYQAVHIHLTSPSRSRS
jgi:anti-sigma factor RsiW